MNHRIEVYNFESHGLGFIGRVNRDLADAVAVAKDLQRAIENLCAPITAYVPLPLDVGDYMEETA